MATFSEMLEAIERQPYTEVEDVGRAIAKLQEIQKSLAESPEYLSAKAEAEEKTKRSRKQELQQQYDEAKKAAEALLGYELNASRVGNGGACANAYGLLPEGCVPRARFEDMVKYLEVGAPRVPPMTKSEKDTQLLAYLMQCKPIDHEAFGKLLSIHLDAMLAALKELRRLA